MVQVLERQGSWRCCLPTCTRAAGAARTSCCRSLPSPLLLISPYIMCLALNLLLRVLHWLTITLYVRPAGGFWADSYLSQVSCCRWRKRDKASREVLEMSHGCGSASRAMDEWVDVEYDATSLIDVEKR